MSASDRKVLNILLPEERTAKLEMQSEKELQSMCESELNRRNIVYLHLSFRAREKIGWPDLTFVVFGKPYAVELKTATGKLSPEQISVMQRMERNGWETVIVHSFEEFRKLLE